jgi:hypothetical protein
MKQHNILLSIIIFATLSRIAIPPFFGHLPNFSALDALALFCGAYCNRRIAAVALCLASVWIGDVLITHALFYEGFYWQYASYALIALLGATLASRVSFLNVTIASFSSAIIFFVISNFGVWFSGSLYPHSLDGLIACYIAAIPFFKHTLVSDLVFSGVLFGAMVAWRDALQKRLTVL